MYSILKMSFVMVLALMLTLLASTEIVKNTVLLSSETVEHVQESNCPDVHHEIQLESQQPSHGCHSVCIGKMPASKAQLASLQQAFALALISRDQSVKAFSMNESLFRPPISTFV
ncbi:TPA: hypothetical protein ACGVA6_004016 [Vibrio vulnificus]|uniref:hypothetical protein n=1 Tax=Vibrio vulnificus TaxID=672 RepID=UPI002FD6EA52